jgi:hypothetical protein
VSTAAERAAAFLAGAGDDLFAAWAAALVGCGAAEVGAEAVVKRQLPDGSFGELTETRRVLALLDDVGARGGPVAERACAWLRSSQSPQGCWGAPGADAVFETGVLTAILARVGCAPADLLDAAADWLAGRFSPEAVKGFRWSPLAAYAAAFANHPHDAGDGILQWCGRELERGWRAGRFDAVRVARLLLWCDAPSLPGGSVAVGEVVPALRESQAADGSFADGARVPVAERRVEEGAARQRQATWDGLVALLRYP